MRQTKTEQSDLEADASPFARDRAQRAVVLKGAHAYSLVMPPTAFFAGRTALVLQGLPVAHGTNLEVAVFSPARAPRRSGIDGRRIEPHLAHTAQVSGLRVATPGSAWAMLADEVPLPDLVVIGDAIVRVPRDRTGALRPELAVGTRDQLARAASAGRRRGAETLRRSLAEIRVGSSSPLETQLRLDAAASGLPEPELDVEIYDSLGRRIGISEIVYTAWRMVVEVEGDHHRTSRAQWNRDLDKYAAYADAGWEVVRVSSAHIRGGSAVPRIIRTLERRGWSAGVPR